MTQEYKPSSFIAKFYSILKNKNYESVIKYEQSNAKICIFDKEKLEIQILPYFFRHNKFTSFIRQLNLYGFKKIKNDSILSFTHPTLLQGKRFLQIIAKKKNERNNLDEEERSHIHDQLQHVPQFSNYNRQNSHQQLLQSSDLNLFTASHLNNSSAPPPPSSNFNLPQYLVSIPARNPQSITYLIPLQQSYQTNAFLTYFQTI